LRVKGFCGFKTVEHFHVGDIGDRRIGVRRTLDKGNIDAVCDIEFLLREAKPGDALLTIGAGNISRASNELMVLLGTEFGVEGKLRHAD